MGELAKIDSVTRQRGTTQIAMIDIQTGEQRLLTTMPAEDSTAVSSSSVEHPVYGAR